MEAIALKSDLISVVKDIPPPPLVVMSISLKTVPNPKTHHNEVRQISSLRNRHFSLFRLMEQTLVVDFDHFLFCFVVQIVSLAALIHYKFPLDKAPPRVPYQTHFCGEF